LIDKANNSKVIIIEGAQHMFNRFAKNPLKQTIPVEKTTMRQRHARNSSGSNISEEDQYMRGGPPSPFVKASRQFDDFKYGGTKLFVNSLRKNPSE
jgi:hypothetical protein